MTDTVDVLPVEAPAEPDPHHGAREVPRLALVLGFVGRVLIITGLVVLLFVAYELWGTNIQEARAQDGLRGDLDEVFIEAREVLDELGVEPVTEAEPTVIEAGSPEGVPATLPAPPTRALPQGSEAEVLAYFFPPDGEAVARIEVPTIGLDKVVVRGVQVADLRKGPGHYPDTSLAGFAGNAAIAGHRTTYGAPFGRIDELSPGDEIVVTSILGTFTYRVMAGVDAYADQLDMVDEVGDGHVIVRPSDTWVLGDFDDNRITLTACHPKLSSRQRIIVAAELVGEPVSLAITAPADDTTGTGELPSEELPRDDTTDDTADTGFEGTVFDEPVAGRFGFDVRPPTNAATSSLDEGLDGDRGAIPAATAWMLGAIVMWVSGGLLGRRMYEGRLARIAMRGAWLFPALVCLWFSFEKIDRALPAG